MLTLESILQARKAISGKLHVTPLLRSASFSAMAQGEIFVKAECLQKTGSFKPRGALNKISKLSEEERMRGVIAASTGNHAQGVAYAARMFGVKSAIVMPDATPKSKVEAARSYGAEVVLIGGSYAEAYDAALQLQSKRNMTFVHAFDDADVIAGQGTIGLEILEALPEVEQVIVPVGGGGLISGTALAIKEQKRGVRVIGAESEASPSMKASLEKGEIVSIAPRQSIAEGIAIKTPGKLPFQMAKKYVDEMVAVSEEEIAKAMVLILERMKLVTEGAGAVSLAACLSGQVQCRGRKTAVLLSGGNVDMELLARVIMRVRSINQST